MKKENKMLFFVPLVGKTSACRQKGGFTLIELLVVVLIIGILAAVALPQYKTAVLKSRLTQAHIFGSALKKAEEVYFLSEGKYTLDMSELDISAPSCVVDTEAAAATPGEHVYYNCANDIRVRLYQNGNLFSIYTIVSSAEGRVLIEYYMARKNLGSCASNYAAGKKSCLAMGGVEGATYGETTYFLLP